MPRFVQASFAALLFAFACAASAQMPRFDQLEKELKIRPEQKEQFDMAVGATQRALLAIAATAMQFKDRLANELLKSRPDIRRFFESQEDVLKQTRPLFKEAGREWRKLFATLDDEQVEIARRFIERNLGQLLGRILKEPALDEMEQI